MGTGCERVRPGGENAGEQVWGGDGDARWQELRDSHLARKYPPPFRLRHAFPPRPPYPPPTDLQTVLMRKDILPEDETRFYIAETVLGIAAIHKHRCVCVCVWGGVLGIDSGHPQAQVRGASAMPLHAHVRTTVILPAAHACTAVT